MAPDTSCSLPGRGRAGGRHCWSLAGHGSHACLRRGSRAPVWAPPVGGTNFQRQSDQGRTAQAKATSRGPVLIQLPPGPSRLGHRGARCSAIEMDSGQTCEEKPAEATPHHDWPCKYFQTLFEKTTSLAGKEINFPLISRIFFQSVTLRVQPLNVRLAFTVTAGVVMKAGDVHALAARTPGQAPWLHAVRWHQLCVGPDSAGGLSQALPESSSASGNTLLQLADPSRPHSHTALDVPDPPGASPAPPAVLMALCSP